MKVAIFLLAIVAAAVATSHDSYKPSYPATYSKPAYSGYKDNYDYAPAYYNFDYAVKDDYTYVDFGHNENRNGDNTKGQYFVVLPDGRRQVVDYHVDGYSGYVADVKYEGGYKTYDYKPAYSAPAYSKPAYHAPSYEAPSYSAPVY